MEHAASIDPTTSYFSTYYIPASIPGKTSFLPVKLTIFCFSFLFSFFNRSLTEPTLIVRIE